MERRNSNLGSKEKALIRFPVDKVDNVVLRKAKILYASLDEQNERRRAIQSNIGNILSYAVVGCIDGRGWSDSDAETFLSTEMRETRRNEFAAGKTWLATGAIACAITHRDHMIAQCHPIGKVLCEDDALIQEDFVGHIASGEVANVLDALPGVTLLNYRARSQISADQAPIAKIGRYSIHRSTSQGIASAAAYFVPASVASKIVKEQTPLRWPVDAWLAMRDAGVFGEVFLVHPSPARVGDFASTINYGRDGGRILQALRHTRVLRRLRWWLLERQGKTYTRINFWT